MVHILRLCLVPRIDFSDLLIDQFAHQLHPTLLLERNRHFFVLDQVTVAFRRCPTPALH